MRRVVAVLLLVAIAAVLSADRLELENGDVISGTITSMDAQTISIQTEYGMLEIPRHQVVRGEFGTADVTIAPVATVEAAAAEVAGEPEASSDLDGSAASGTLLPQPLLHFALDGSLSDATGRYELVNNGLVYAEDAAGAEGRALRSAGTGTYLSVAGDDALNAVSDFTITMNVYLEDASGTGYLASKWARADGETADGKFTIQTRDGGLTVFLVGPDDRYYWMSARRVLEQRQWQSVAVRFDGGVGSILVNGEPVYGRTFPFESLAYDTAPLLLMTAEAATDDPFGHYNVTGVVDDIRLYATALSDAEVARIASGDA